LYFESVHWIKDLGRLLFVWRRVPPFEPAAASRRCNFATLLCISLGVDSGSRSAMVVTAAVIRSSFADGEHRIVRTEGTGWPILIEFILIP